MYSCWQKQDVSTEFNSNLAFRELEYLFQPDWVKCHKKPNSFCKSWNFILLLRFRSGCMSQHVIFCDAIKVGCKSRLRDTATNCLILLGTQWLSCWTKYKLRYTDTLVWLTVISLNSDGIHANISLNQTLARGYHIARTHTTCWIHFRDLQSRGF